MNRIKLKELIIHRQALDINDDQALMECWKAETDILSDNISESIDFILASSDDEFYWLSEVFDDLIERTQSHELFTAICQRHERITNLEYKDSIDTDIQYARDSFEE